MILQLCKNSLDQAEFAKESPNAISFQDDGLSCILEDPQNESRVNDNSASSDKSRSRGYFCVDTFLI